MDMDNNIVRVAVALRLGAAVTKPHLCQRPVDRLGHEGLSGVKSDGLSLNVTLILVSDVLRPALDSVGLERLLESTGLGRGRRSPT